MGIQSPPYRGMPPVMAEAGDCSVEDKVLYHRCTEMSGTAGALGEAFVVAGEAYEVHVD